MTLSLKIDADWQQLRQTWVMQAWLLHIIYGAFMGDVARYVEAKKMLRTLVDVSNRSQPLITVSSPS